ncbi:hypothetical protein FRB90_003788 [Tulasnella sp. 427]|nr:hypothetical protein FRB90_003788 [Tulasnella sp. 427]
MPSIHPLSRSHQHRIEQKYNVVTEYPNLRLHGAAAKGDIGQTIVVRVVRFYFQLTKLRLVGVVMSIGSVQYALTHGQPANSVLDGILPLHAACSGGSDLVVKLLIDFGADVNAPRLPRRYSDKKSEGGTIIGSSGGPTTAPLADGPPSPSKSRKLQVKRSLENLLTRKGHGMTPAHSASTNAALSPFMTFGQGVDSGAASPFGGFSTPASSSSEAFVPLPASGARRPSLPHIFECPHPAAPAASPHKKGGSRPRSAGQGAEEHSTMPTGGAQKRLAAKISLLNIFKKDPSTSNPPPLGAGYHASSPNLLEFLSQPVEPGIRTRQRNSIDEPRVLSGNPGPSRGSLDRGDRERHSPPTTAPAQRTLFFNQSSSAVFHPEDQEDLPPLPSVLLPRTSRSNSQTRGYPDYRTRTDSNVTMTSTGSSLEAQQNPASYAIQNNWARAKRDRSASEGAGALGKRSPLMNEWGRDEDGNIVEKDLPGVIADDDEDSAESAVPGPEMSTSPEQIRPIDSERKTSKPPQLPSGPRRPSLTNGGTGGGSSGSYSPAEHRRTNSTQSTKNLRFDLPADGQPQRSVSSTAQPTVRSQASPATTSPTSPLVPRSTKKALRTSASAGSLPKSKPSSSSSSADRPSSAGGERAGKSGRRVKTPRRPSTMENAYEEEDHIAAQEAEGGDSFGELVPRVPTARSGSMSSGYSARPPLQTLVSPATPGSGISTLYSPTSASTVSAGGRPWAYPDTANTSQTSLPPAAAKAYSSLSVKGAPTGAEGDSRLRGASVSSSKSTDTSASSANVATASSSNGASDSSSPQHQGPGWSTSTSTASAGTTGKNGTIRGPKLGPIVTGAVYRHPYEIDDYDSSSSEKPSKDTTPLPLQITPATQRNPDITVSDFETVPLSRVSTAPSPNEKGTPVPNFSQIHGRTVSSGNPVVLQGPEDYYPPRSESRTGGKQRFGGLRNLVQTLKGK